MKWYIQPLFFGGDPLSEENVTWVSHTEHAELVRWWNNVYFSVKIPGKPMWPCSTAYLFLPHITDATTDSPMTPATVPSATAVGTL
jgi:hypothetical protein